jgi:hypothetical protein
VTIRTNGVRIRPACPGTESIKPNWLAPRRQPGDRGHARQTKAASPQQEPCPVTAFQSPSPALQACAISRFRRVIAIARSIELVYATGAENLFGKLLRFNGNGCTLDCRDGPVQIVFNAFELHFAIFNDRV